jgi:hypothetical protein
VAASADCFDTPTFCNRRHKDFREHVSHRFSISSVSSEKTHSNLTSVLLKEEYVAHDLYISLYIDFKGNETLRN